MCETGETRGDFRRNDEIVGEITRVQSSEENEIISQGVEEGRNKTENPTPFRPRLETNTISWVDEDGGVLVMVGCQADEVE